MHEPSIVTVYSFRTYGAQAEQPQVAGFKATREVIQALGGELLEATAEEVDRCELDAHGRFRRRATGWGELQ